MKVYRAWINQPSTLQPYHKWHGQKVLVVENENDVRVYFLDGEVISMKIDRLALSPGWK